MALKRIIDGVYLVPMGSANAYLLDVGPDLILVDAGFPNKAPAVLDAIRQLGRQPGDLKHIVFTHGHPDHIGSAAALVHETGATTWMHAADVPLAETGGPFRPMTVGRGFVPRIGFRLFWHPAERMQPFKIDRHLDDGETLPVAGGFRIIHVPGHCAGQVALLRQDGRLLIAGDVCMNLLGIGDPLGFEDIEDGRRSQRKLAGLTFEAACFGHGSPITSGADARFRRAFSG